MKPRLIICLLLLLCACGAPDPSAPPLTAAAPATPTAPPATPTPDPQALADELAAEVAATLDIEPPPAADAPDRPLRLEGVAALPLTVATGQEPLWAVYPLGYATDAPHFVAIYARRGGQWRELSRLDLPPDSWVIREGWARQLALPSDDLWIAVDSGMGAHSAAYDLLRWDGARLHSALHDVSPVAVWGREEDLDGDGVLDLLRDHRNTYIFCHACGLAVIDYRVWRWADDRLVAIRLTSLPASAPPELRSLNDAAVRLAQGGLWLDAQSRIAQAAALAPDDRMVRWNKVLIDLQARGFAEQRESRAYPPLAAMLYGDYQAALAPLRAYTPAQLFDQAHPPRLGEFDLPAEWITRTATAAIEADPERAAAYFLRGWANSFAAETRALTLPDLQRAAALAPDEPLFRDSLALLEE